MASQKRKITLQKRYRPGDDRIVPELRLSGVWLEEIGFSSGKRVDIDISKGKLVIRVDNG